MKFELPNMKKIFRGGHAFFLGHDNLLDDYFDVDRKNMIVTATFEIEKASDIVNTEFVNKSGKVILNDVIWEKISKVMQMVPRAYRLKFVFEIDDMCGYTTDILMSSLRDSINMKYYGFSVDMKRKAKAALTLTFFGVLLLILNVVMQVNHPFGDTAENIISEVIDISAWVFVWEAVTIYFLDGGELRRGLKNIKKRIVDITLLNMKTKHMSEEGKKTLFKDKSTSIIDKISSGIIDTVLDDEKKDELTQDLKDK